MNRFLDEELIIYREEKESPKILYVAVGSAEQGAYAFQLFYKSGIIELELGEVFVSSMKSGGIQNFLIRLNPQVDSTYNNIVSVVLNAQMGSAITSIGLCEKHNRQDCNAVEDN